MIEEGVGMSSNSLKSYLIVLHVLNGELLKINGLRIAALLCRVRLFCALLSGAVPIANLYFSASSTSKIFTFPPLCPENLYICRGKCYNNLRVLRGGGAWR